MSTIVRPGVLLALSLIACRRESPMSPQVITTATFAPSLGVDLAASTAAPSGLYHRDLVVGTGAEATAGQQVTVHYAGAFIDGKEFDASRKRGPFAFRLGGGRVIAGWDQGVAGMRVGGTRQLIVPSSLGYGADDYGPIPGGSILVFTVELLGID